MSRTATTHPGETLDQLCWRALGTTAPVADVYALNPGLADAGPILPGGIAVTLPETATAPAAQVRDLVQLWS